MFDFHILCYSNRIPIFEVNDIMQVKVLDSENTKENNKGPTTFSRTNPFQAKVLKNVNLNGAGSSKETRHIELSLEGSGPFLYPR